MLTYSLGFLADSDGMLGRFCVEWLEINLLFLFLNGKKKPTMQLSLFSLFCGFKPRHLKHTL